MVYAIEAVSYTHLDVYKRQHQVFVARNQHTGLCPLVGAPFAFAGTFGRLNQVVAVLFAENAALLSILPEEAVPAICRAGSMVADLSLIHISLPCIQSVYARFKSVFEQS